VGYGKGWIAGLRNFIAVKEAKDWVAEGYDKYNRQGNAFVTPQTLGMLPEVILPPNQLRWMFDQPDNVMSTSEGHYEFLHGDYSFVDPIVLQDPYHEHVIHKHLVRNLTAIIPGLAEEVPRAVAAVYGTDTKEWKKLELLQSFMDTIPTLTNRMLLGEPICHERKYLDAVLAFTLDVIRNLSVLFLVPRALHAFVGPVLSLAPKYHYWISSKFTVPVIKKRISDITKKDAGDPEYKDWQEPCDFITWSYRTAQSEGRHDEMRPERIAKRILPLNFASIHTTAMTANDALGMILSAGPEVIEGLREEAHRVRKEEGAWTKQTLSRMVRMDSAIRESQRMAPIALTFAGRKVVSKQGVTTPDGVHIGYGNLVSCPWGPMAADTEYHENPDVYDAFRFSRAQEEYETMSPDEKANCDVLKMKQKGMVTTATYHLPFSHGKHACPGRFFVSHELKIFFAEFLLNYDIKPLAEPPKKMWMIRSVVPLPTTIEVRRRESPWTPESRT